MITFKPMLTISILMLFLSSCNNEELFYAQTDELIVEDVPIVDNPNPEDILTVLLGDDSYTTMQGVPIVMAPYTNDENIPAAFILNATSPTSGMVTIDDTSTPDNFLDDIITYTPNSGFFGTDTFEYSVCDAANSQNCDTAMVTIIVNPVQEDIATELKAFPSAYGAGAYTTGGRGGTIIHVTTLNDSGAGSFREAITTPGPRYIIFDVSGVIQLQSQIRVVDGDMTVNGFSAPYGGITIIGYAIVTLRVDNIIWRGLRFRNGYRGATGYTNATELQHRECTNVMVDRCSFAYAGDGGSEGKGVSFIAGGSDEYGGEATIQNCLFGNSYEGYMIGNTSNPEFGDISCLRNVSSNNYHRHPKMGGVDHADVINNITHGWGWRAIRAEIHPTTKINLINNRFTRGKNLNSNSTGGTKIHGYDDRGGEAGGAQIYENGNYIDINIPNYDTQPWNAWFDFPWDGSDQTIPSTIWVNSQITGISGATPIILDASDLKAELLPKVGVCEYIDDSGNVQFYRDAIDTALVYDVENDISPSWINTSDYQGLAEDLPNTMPSSIRPNLNTSTGTSDYDTDADGMADDWEIVTFGDLTKTSSGDQDNDGYTNIEEFLNRVDN